MRRGTLPIDKVPMRVGDAVEQAVEAVRPLVDSRGHDLTVSLPTEPLWVEADPVRLEQVVVNHGNIDHITGYTYGRCHHRDQEINGGARFTF